MLTFYIEFNWNISTIELLKISKYFFQYILSLARAVSHEHTQMHIANTSPLTYNLINFTMAGVLSVSAASLALNVED